MLASELDCSRMRGWVPRHLRGSREDAERSIEDVRGDDPELGSYLRIEERELEGGELNSP